MPSSVTGATLNSAITVMGEDTIPGSVNVGGAATTLPVPLVDGPASVELTWSVRGGGVHGRVRTPVCCRYRPRLCPYNHTVGTPPVPMVALAGHLGMALLFAVPAWFLWRRRPALAFVGLALSTATLPDVDLFLADVVPTVHHHGVTHTVPFTVLVSVLGGAVLAVSLAPRLHRRVDFGETSPRETLFVFATGAFLTGGLSHLFADTLSAPDIARPIEPFWPLYNEPISFDVVHYDDPTVNVGLLLLGFAAHAALFVYSDARITTRYRIGRS